jgi:hypothetical protein
VCKALMSTFSIGLRSQTKPLYTHLLSKHLDSGVHSAPLQERVLLLEELK